jgi:nucleotide-binding universal stress UspA family protein
MEASMEQGQREGQGGVVVGTDGSASAREAVRQAAVMARARGVALHIVGAYDPPTYRDRYEARRMRVQDMGFDVGVDNRQATRAMLEDAAEEVIRPDLRVWLHAVQDDPVEALVSVAARKLASVLVVGNKPAGGLRRMFVRPICVRLEAVAPCPVHVVDTRRYWTVRGRGPARAADRAAVSV